MRNFKTKTLNAASWSLASNGVSQFLSFFIGIFLARLLTPDDFGLVAMTVVFTAFASLFSNIGLDQALIQKQDIKERHINSVFWLNLLIAIFMAAIMFAAAPNIADFYGREQVESICKAYSITYVIGAFAVIPRIQLIKNLNFKIISSAELIAMIVSGIIAITCAMNGFSYWALVIHRITQQLIISFILIFYVKWRPSAIFSSAALKEIMGFSLSIFGTKLLKITTQNIDNLLIGKFLGGELLGSYDKSRSIMLTPIKNISQVIGNIMFPSLSLINADKPRVKAIYLRIIRSISIITFPMMVGMIVVSESFVLGVLGEQWEEIVPLVKVFCFLGIFSSILTVTGTIFQSQGAAGLQFRTNLLTQPIRIACVIIGLNWGVMGVALGFALSGIFNSLIVITVAGKLIDLKPSTFLQALAPTLAPTLIMGVSVWYIGEILRLDSELLTLSIQVLSGAIIYLSSLALLKIEAYQDMRNVFEQHFLNK
jgi:O-antigen/teichoic acid export membrane protein